MVATPLFLIALASGGLLLGIVLALLRSRLGVAALVAGLLAAFVGGAVLLRMGRSAQAAAQRAAAQRSVAELLATQAMAAARAGSPFIEVSIDRTPATSQDEVSPGADESDDDADDDSVATTHNVAPQAPLSAAARSRIERARDRRRHTRSEPGVRLDPRLFRVEELAWGAAVAGEAWATPGTERTPVVDSDSLAATGLASVRVLNWVDVPREGTKEWNTLAQSARAAARNNARQRFIRDMGMVSSEPGCRDMVNTWTRLPLDDRRNIIDTLLDDSTTRIQEAADAVLDNDSKTTFRAGVRVTLDRTPFEELLRDAAKRNRSEFVFQSGSRQRPGIHFGRFLGMVCIVAILHFISRGMQARWQRKHGF